MALLLFALLTMLLSAFELLLEFVIVVVVAVVALDNCDFWA